MIIYGDILFMENMIIGGVLLYITGEIHETGWVKPGQRWRLVLGSVLCGGFSLIIFLSVRMPLALMLELVFAIIVCMVVFGQEKNADRSCMAGRISSRIPWLKALTFLLATYFMGGMTMGLLLVVRKPGIYTAAGIYTGDMKAGLLTLFVAIFLETARQLVRTVAAGKFYRQHFYHVKLHMAGQILETTGFADTGNSLKEPMGNSPVAVAGSRLWQEMEALGMIREERLCIIPYETVGGKGILTGVRVDALEVGDRWVKPCVIAGGGDVFRDGKGEGRGWGLLLSKDMMKR